MKTKIKKALLKSLLNTPENKALLLANFSISFQNATGECFVDHKQVFLEVMQELEDRDYARLEKLPNGTLRILEGVDFDEWEQSMRKYDSSNVYNIENITAENLQMGDYNLQKIGIGFESFIRELNNSDISIEEKTEVKQQLKTLLGNASVASILGGTVSGLLSLL